ncbi:MAG: hypothetical protein ACRESS_12170 [Stenotrophobium sp.]
MKVTKIFFFFAIVLLQGCASINEKMASFMGHDESDLIASWGPPSQVMDDGNGGQIKGTVLN